MGCRGIDILIGFSAWAFTGEAGKIRFLTIYEVHKNDPQIFSVDAAGADELSVKLKDGRTQKFVIKNLEKQGKNITVDVIETRDGEVIGKETVKHQL